MMLKKEAVHMAKKRKPMPQDSVERYQTDPALEELFSMEVDTAQPEKASAATDELLSDDLFELIQDPDIPEEELQFSEPAEQELEEVSISETRRIWPKVVKWVLIGLFVLTLLVFGGLGYLTATEYRPAYAESAQLGNFNTDAKLTGETLRLVTLNTGYGGLDDGADFFMDGGENVNPSSREQIEQNMIGIEDMLRAIDADIMLLQEVDTGSKRSFDMDQWRQYEFDFGNYESRYALNYSCNYVPYPLPTIGEVHSGIATYSRYDIAGATRYSLPCPFGWPIRVANLKRCLLVTRIPIEGRTQELVVVNLHLEAYDDGDGRAVQTEMLMQILQKEYEKGNYVIAGGDFNQSFPDSGFPFKDTTEWRPGTLKELPKGWSYAYDTDVPSCRLLNQPYDPDSALTQHYVIDGFIVSPNLEIVSVETQNGNFAVTDHNPVVLEVKLN